VFAAINVAHLFPGQVARAGMCAVVYVDILVALKAVEKHSTEAFVEIFFQTNNNFLEQIPICRALYPASLLDLLILVKN